LAQWAADAMYLKGRK